MLTRISAFFLMSALISFSLFAQSGNYYVDPSAGNDANSGTIDLPYKTVAKALTVATAGGTIWLRAGTYTGTFTFNKSGTADNYLKMWAYPGEKPWFNCTGANDGITISGSYVHLKGIDESLANHVGISITGSNNLIENCTIHHNGNTGLHMGKSSGTGKPSNNYILNCDAYYNYDPPIGGNADGFACKWNIGPGNRFKGCRSWNNSDDGWDLWMATSSVSMDSCFAFRNGVDAWHSGSFAGNGNGFKVGGSHVAAPHFVRNCVAFDDTGYKGGKGFDQNNNDAGQTILNCTSFRNKSGNFVFNMTLTTGQHTVKNCISLEGTVAIINGIQENNSWQGYNATAADFISIDTSLALAARKPDGSLPDNGFFRLAAGSQFIDAGTNVGLPFTGKAPDMGAFEYRDPSGVKGTAYLPESFRLEQNFPNPFNPSTVISYQVPARDFVTLKVFDLLGREVATLVNEEKQAGRYDVRFNCGSEYALASGTYYYRLQTGNSCLTNKMLYIK